MNLKYVNLYNNLIKLTTNKNLYEGLVKKDTFNDRLFFFFLHFAFFLKAFKKKENSIILQEIYDFCFRQLELSIREIGYGDQSVNKKMKDYINLFHSIVAKVDKWDLSQKSKKKELFDEYLDNFIKTDYLVDYFNNYYVSLTKKTLNFYLKSVFTYHYGSSKA